jgi:hypothetical protein
LLEVRSCEDAGAQEANNCCTGCERAGDSGFLHAAHAAFNARGSSFSV